MLFERRGAVNHGKSQGSLKRIDEVWSRLPIYQDGKGLDTGGGKAVAP